jgi:hypothetical protein
MREIKIVVQIDRINFFSDTFIKFYTHFFEKRNIYFVHDEGLIKKIEIKKYLKKKKFNNNEINIITFDFDIPKKFEDRIVYATSFLNELQIKLFNENSNIVLIFPDIDELIIFDDINILQTFEDHLITYPMDVVQNLDIEPEIDFSKNIFDQRSYYLSPKNPVARWYIKKMIFSKPVDFGDGRHFAVTPKELEELNKMKCDPKTGSIFGCYLIHLGKIDYNFIVKLNEQNLTMYHNFEISQNGFTGEQLFRWYVETHANSLDHEGDRNLLTIPDHIKDILLSIPI